jgi:hypothetical protein
MKTTNKITLVSISLLLLLSGCGGGGGDKSGGTDSPVNGNSKLVISEVLAENNSTNQDPDLNQFSDWIEVQNVSSSQIDISGYGLSDGKKVKWNFPNGTTVAAGEYLLVWADDFNTSSNPNPTALHANFKIKSNDERVSLFDKTGTLIDQIKLKDYKITEPDISIARHSDGTFVLASTPTPGFANSSTSVVVSKKPSFSVDEGVYLGAFDVTITAGNGASIYYTTDGSDPTIDSELYTAPISISENKTTLKAIAKEQGSGKIISKEKSKTYVIAPAHDVVINEVFADSNASLTGFEQSDWVELYNTSGADISLDGYRLSDSKKLENSNWTFPNGTTINANGYLIVWADKTDTGLHSDFKLSDSGDSVVLYNDNDLIIDFIDYDKLKDGKSLSRQGDNNFTKVTPTPEAINGVN